jgi:hypothetical protein
MIIVFAIFVLSVGWGLLHRFKSLVGAIRQVAQTIRNIRIRATDRIAPTSGVIHKTALKLALPVALLPAARSASTCSKSSSVAPPGNLVRRWRKNP